MIFYKWFQGYHLCFGSISKGPNAQAALESACRNGSGTASSTLFCTSDNEKEKCYLVADIMSSVALNILF